MVGGGMKREVKEEPGEGGREGKERILKVGGIGWKEGWPRVQIQMHHAS